MCVEPCEHLCRKCIQSCWELAQILQVCISSSSFYTGLQLNMFGHHCNNSSPKPTWVILLPTDSSWNFQPLTFENVQLVRMCCINIMCQPSLWHFPLSLKPFILYHHIIDKIKLKTNALFLVHSVNHQSCNYSLDFVQHEKCFCSVLLYLQDEVSNFPSSHLEILVPVWCAL